MSQTVTLYRVSQNTFKQLEISKGMIPFDTSCAKFYLKLDQAIGLEYILSKGKSDHETKLISEIFCPGTIIGWEEFEALTIEERFEFLHAYETTSYINIDTIQEIDSLLKNISKEEISLNFNSEEEISLNFNSDKLNAKETNAIKWYNDNFPNLNYNERHILDGFSKLQMIFREAVIDGDYIVVDYGSWHTELKY